MYLKYHYIRQQINREQKLATPAYVST